METGVENLPRLTVTVLAVDDIAKPPVVLITSVGLAVRRRDR